MAVAAAPKTEPKRKKPYHPPKLTKYGSVRELTKGPKPVSHRDGGWRSGKSY